MSKPEEVSYTSAAASDTTAEAVASALITRMKVAQATKTPQGFCGFRADKGPQPGNTSGFSATGHRLLLLGEVVEEVSAGGIILQRKTVEAEKNIAVWATVVEIGHDAWADKSTDYCQVGDKVLVGQYAGKFHTSPNDGKEYRFINDLDIITPLKKKE